MREVHLGEKKIKITVCTPHTCVLSLNFSCWLLVGPGDVGPDGPSVCVNQCDYSGVGDYLPWKVSGCPLKDLQKANTI